MTPKTLRQPTLRTLLWACSLKSVLFSFPDEQDKIVEKLRSGAVGVMPTDTLYGLVCCADQQDSVARLYALKKRDNKPGTIIASNIEQLTALGLKARYLKPVQHYWPGAVSIVIPCFDLPYLHLGKGSVAVRVVADRTLQKVLLKTGALLTSSANQPGEQPAATIEAAREYFGDAVDFYADGGDMGERHASTVIRVVDDVVEVLRQGAVRINEETGEIA